MIGIYKAAGVQYQLLGTDVGELLHDLEIVERAVFRQNLLEQLSQLGNVPLSCSQIVDQPPNGIPLFETKFTKERLVRCINTQITIKNQQRFANGGDNALRVVTGQLDLAFDFFKWSILVNVITSPSILSSAVR